MCVVRQELPRHMDDLERFARSLIGGGREADVQDLVHDSVELALKKADQFEKGTNLKSWMMTLLRNHFISTCRKHQVRKRYETLVEKAGNHSAPANQFHSLLLQETVDQMRDLDGRERGLLIDMAVHEHSQKAVADQQGVATGTIKSRLSRTRRKLREMTEACNDQMMPQAA